MPTLRPHPHAPRRLSLALVATVSLAGLSVCVEERDPHIGEGVHPRGWADPESPAFHKNWLHENGDDLARCRECHGADYAGGPVGVTCRSTDCHPVPADPRTGYVGGPEACGTCHGDREADDPRPNTGAHQKHTRFCSECHVVPRHVGDEGHIGDDHAGPDITFSGLATADDATPTYNPEEPKTCSGVYCHQDGTPEWNAQGPLECDACHHAPPDDHVRFAAVAQPPDDCATCHPDPTDEEALTHVDGTVELQLPDGCGTCHGHDDTGAPPAALSHEPDDPAIGAHARHLDPNAADRVAPPIACDSCHVVPTEDDVLAEGHIDTEAPADVTVLGGEGTYDPENRTCVVWCHYDRDPGPSFGDESTTGPACDACHEAPPANHARFSYIADGVDSCGICHPAPPADTHVNHTLDLALPNGCGTCHGSNDEGYPPVDLAGNVATTNRGVGAHQRHLDPNLPDRISPPVPCQSCHVVPENVEDDGHIDTQPPADVVLTEFDPDGEVVDADGIYDGGAGQCTVGCHWDRDPGPIWTNQTGIYRQCGSCHTMPPATVRDSGIAHPASGPDLADCVACHFNFSFETHVNGRVDF